MSDIIAQGWWRQHAGPYPYERRTFKDRRLHPQAITQASKGLDFISTGLREGGRIWAFKTQEAAKKFDAIVAELLA